VSAPESSGEDTTVTNRIDINADIAESFGRWSLGEDSELVKLVTTVNVACGWHAGDPATMHRSVQMAAEAGVNIGAHPGFPDLLGFGRRPIVIDDTDAVDYVLYQVGALMGIASRFGVELSHVKQTGPWRSARPCRACRREYRCCWPPGRAPMPCAPPAYR
jgi:5-oxoprolinase (ATP-hydrolysing) subunit A